MWEDIFMSNQINMLEVIKSFKSELDHLEKLIEESDSEKLNQFITSAKEFRDSLTSVSYTHLTLPTKRIV